jgi:hypothetical protein
LLQQVDAPIAGVVLNGVTEVGGYKHYRYDAYVGRDGDTTGETSLEEVVL